ncbi:hypothetical protein POX_b02697 [Penicillium oxalicum]|nr:hypothetical protein POX_b02697 [Penicillium oxalicum]KAI2792657.1 hypothetical protein POX_b02697 [Penicillium oxalicum]
MISHPGILTPISLPDNSFRPSPALSHHSHSQDYSSQEYRYGINDTLQPQGLGITAPFPSEYPRTSAPASNYVYAPHDHQYAMGYTPTISPSLPPPKRVKRTGSDAQGVSRNTSAPLTILPDPEGVERLQRERSYSTPGPAVMPPKPRAPGRGRRDPKAEEEDAFVEELREKHVAWKVIREKFYEKFNNDASEARLQMRLLRRRKERQARWEEHDVRLLLSASAMWEIKKYQFIAKKMKDLGSTKEYTPEQCRTQLRYIEAKQRHGKSGSTSPSFASDDAESPFDGPSEPRKRGFQELE